LLRKKLFKSVWQGPRTDALKSGVWGVEKKDPTEIVDKLTFPHPAKRKMLQEMEPEYGCSGRTLSRSWSWTENSGLEGQFIPTIRCCTDLLEGLAQHQRLKQIHLQQ
jgi:hypothetical protein